MGWTGSFATRYLLFRDRKGLVTSFIAILAYLLLANFFLFYLADRFGWWTVYYPSYFRPGGWLVTLMWLNAVALLLRVVQRMYFVGNMYGWEHAVLSVPRMIVGNFINAMAAARAWKLFIGHLITGKRLAWDKTMHDFPSTDQLAQQRQRLGELLLSWQAIDEDKLAQALEIQARDKKPLGTILLEQGWLDAGTLKEAIDFNKARKRKPRPPTTNPPPHDAPDPHAVLSAALACLWTGAPAAAQQAARAAEAPLEGAAWQFANEGYRLYDAGRYAQAQQQAESAIALRPDVERLRLLLIYALQKQGKLDEAERAADDAVKNGLDTPALRQARANLRPATPAARRPMRVRPAPAAGARRPRPAPTAAASPSPRAPTRTTTAATTPPPSAAPSRLSASIPSRAPGPCCGWTRWKPRAVRRSRNGRQPGDDAGRAEPERPGRASRHHEAAHGGQAGGTGLSGADRQPARRRRPLARQAVALAPDTASHRLLLMTALMLDGQLAAAEDAATDALRQDDENTVALVMRGYLRQRQGKTEEADADFDAALKQDWLDDSQRRNVRLIAADAALAGARAPARWPWWNRWAPRTRPAPIASSAPAPARRARHADAGQLSRRSRTAATRPTARPASCCPRTRRAAAAGLAGLCRLCAPGLPGSHHAGPQGRATGSGQQGPAAAADHHAGRRQRGADDRGQPAHEQGPGGPARRSDAVDAARLSAPAHAPAREALRDFQAARATGKAPPTAILDEGYALSGVGDKRGAVDRLKEAIDQDDAGKLDLTRSSASTPAAASPACRASGAATSRPATGARGRPRPAWAARPSRCPATRCSARPRSSGVPPIS